MKFTSGCAVFALPLLACRAATITLFQVQTTTGDPIPSETFKPIGVGADGATTYSNEIVASVYWVQQLNGGGKTYTSDGSTITEEAPRSTFTSDPITIHGTVIADASHFVYNKDPDPMNTEDAIGHHLSCDFDGKGGGSCVNEYWFKDEPTATTTFTGSVVPYHTLVVERNQSGSGSGTTQGNGARPLLVTASWVGVITFGITIGILLV
ncbi:hypothetical protein Hypma_008400 [Hypsizygus marmoreus]|uniref:Cell wall protein RHD3 n=1 Tax=Hypsizygus marmoreus TaxID=39966 RepID=A0A369JR96_HYPMA|nr:hypothetical protein Hypma_008400 [Hypsizygus marmoreus]